MPANITAADGLPPSRSAAVASLTSAGQALAANFQHGIDIVGRRRRPAVAPARLDRLRLGGDDQRAIPGDADGVRIAFDERPQTGLRRAGRQRLDRSGDPAADQRLAEAEQRLRLPSLALDPGAWPSRGEAAQNLLRSLSGSTIEARSFNVEGAGLADDRAHRVAEVHERDLLAHALLPAFDQPERNRPVERRAEIARCDEADRAALAARSCRRACAPVGSGVLPRDGQARQAAGGRSAWHFR